MSLYDSVKWVADALGNKVFPAYDEAPDNTTRALYIWTRQNHENERLFWSKLVRESLKHESKIERSGGFWSSQNHENERLFWSKLARESLKHESKIERSGGF